MKKLKFIFKMLLFAALVAPWASCSKSDDNVPDEGKDKDPYMEVCEHVCDVANQVDVYFDQSQSIEELSQHLDDIKKIPYVEDAYTTSTTLFVKIKDYGKLHYSFFPEPNKYSYISDELLSKTQRKAPSNTLKEHPLLEPKRICIANAQYVEYLTENKKEDRDYIARTTKQIFDALDSEVDLINAPNLYFFSKMMYDYDIVFLIAHGCYDPDDNLHWIDGNEVANLNPDEIYKNKGYTEDQVSFSKYKYTGEWWWGPLDNRTVSWYASVSEKFIKETPGEISDEKKGKPIFFSVPCQSLMGNDNMGQAFLDKGFGAYYGYTESNYYGQEAYFHMLNNMLSGMSLENAFNALPEIYKDESKDTELVEKKTKEKKYKEIPKAKLESLPRNESAEINKTCIIKPITEKPEEMSIERNKIQIRLSGKAPFWSLYTSEFSVIDNESGELKTMWGILLPDSNPLSYGFFISETTDYRNASQVCFISSADEENYEYNNFVVSFHYDLTYEPLSLQNLIVPGKDYYVWSYVYDGRDFYLSDPETFTTGSIKNVNTSNSEIPDIPGTDF